MYRFLRLLFVTVLVLGFTSAPRGTSAAVPYEIDAILSLSGSGTFIGSEQWQAIQAVESLINRSGGVKGRPVHFVVQDDQSDPKNALQMAQALVDKHVPIILGPSLSSSCNSITPIVQQNGPVLYCLTNAGNPPAGGYVFSTLPSTDDMLAAGIRYFRERGLRRIAYIVSTDASGQDAERAIKAALALPENSSMSVVDREYFAATDISVTAQMNKIQTAAPQAMIAWATGTPAGTLFRSARDAGLQLPTITTPGNLNYSFFQQYAQIVPSELYFAAIPYYAASDVTDRKMKNALDQMTTALAAINKKPDQIYISSWDPAMLLVNVLQQLGSDASSNAIRQRLLSVRNWTGVNGTYDFVAHPQRGVGQTSIVMVRWNAAKNNWTTASAFGGGLRK